MVTRYNVISSRWSSHFWVKIHVFSTFFNTKSKTCEQNDTKCLFMCYFTCQVQKKPFIAILTWFLILGKIQDGGLWRATTHKIYLISLRGSNALHWRQNRFEIKSKTPLPLLYPGRVWILRPRVRTLHIPLRKNTLKKQSDHSTSVCRLYRDLPIWLRVSSFPCWSFSKYINS